jgi:hypothetical protein
MEIYLLQTILAHRGHREQSARVGVSAGYLYHPQDNIKLRVCFPRLVMDISLHHLILVLHGHQELMMQIATGDLVL